MEKHFDLLIKNARVVRPNKTSVDRCDIGVADGKIDRVAPNIQADQAEEIFDAKNFLAFPGCVDAHMHVGIYQPLIRDAVSESKAAAMGGVTSSLNYMRTGQYDLNRGGPYRDFMPEVHRQVDRRFWIDYGFHIAPIEAAHIGEMELLALDHGITSFKIFMFYGRPARTVDQSERFPDARPAGALRPRAFRIHHAFRPTADDEASRACRICKR
jgi:allantoinase